MFGSAGSLRRLTNLRRLLVETTADNAQTEPGIGDIVPEHAAVLGRDLVALTSLEELTLSHSAPCYAPAIANSLQRLTLLTLSQFGPRAVCAAVSLRVQRGGISVFDGQSESTHKLSAGDLEVMMEEMDDDDEEEDEEHARLHRSLLDEVAEAEAEDEAVA